jgi:hypothetical protein
MPTMLRPRHEFPTPLFILALCFLGSAAIVLVVLLAR